MGWIDIAAGRRDAYSPITAEFLDDHADNDEALMHRTQLVPVLWGRSFSLSQADGSTFFHGQNQTRGDLVTQITTIGVPQRIFVPEHADLLVWTGQAWTGLAPPGSDIELGMRMVINDTDEGPVLVVVFANSGGEYSKIVTVEIDVTSHVGTVVDLRWKFRSNMGLNSPVFGAGQGIFTGKVHGSDAPSDNFPPRWQGSNVYKETYGLRWRHSNEASEADADQGGTNDP